MQIEQCLTTNEGPQKSTLCQFPFKYADLDGKVREHKRCIPDKMGKYFCPTSQSDMFSRKGNNEWGYCSEKCPRDPKGKFLYWLMMNKQNQIMAIVVISIFYRNTMLCCRRTGVRKKLSLPIYL